MDTDKIILLAAFTKVITGEVITPEDFTRLLQVLAEKVQVDASPEKLQETKVRVLQFLHQWIAALEKSKT